MTEAEWLTANDAMRSFKFVTSFASERKHRLFSAACFQHVPHLFPDPRQQTAIELLEQMACAEVESSLLRRVTAAARAAIPPSPRVENDGSSDDLHFAATMLDRELVSSRIAVHAVTVPASLADGQAERKWQSQILRDIFGNPFRPVAFDPAWLTPTVVALANGIYTDRAFDRLPILADALEEAGCDSTEVLLHCRGDGPHVKGCWVVDAVLGKE